MQDGTRTVRLAAVRYDRKTTYRFLFVPQRQRPAGAAGGGDAELLPQALAERSARTCSRRRIKLYTVRAGDTQERLARRLPYDELPLRRFQVLNDLDPGEALEPGQVVKLVE